VATFDVLLPVRNGLPYLGESIDSIRNQTLSDWRLLVLDHGSSDGSLELAQRYAEKDDRIKVFSFPEADGLGGLLNLGLDKCDCKYVVRQDADDVAYLNRMELATEAFAADPTQMVVAGEAVMIDVDGHRIGYSFRPIGSQRVTAATFFYCSWIHGASTIKFDAFKKAGASYGADILKAVPASESISVKQYAEDYFLFGQLALLGVCNNIRVPLIKFRVHSTSTSQANLERQLNLSYSVSRFLSKSLSRMKNLPDFDPVPFSNHHGIPFRDDKLDLSEEFRQMSEILTSGLGDSAALRRELAFRRVLADGRPFGRMMRYAGFELTHRDNSLERGVMRGWLRQPVRRYLWWALPSYRLIRAWLQ
jgi:glycosyltransferase involved in cell wall biosynthesis